MGIEVSYADILAELQKLSGDRGIENIKDARTIAEWQSFWGVSEGRARATLNNLKDAGCIKVVKKQVERLDGGFRTVNAFVIELKPEVKTSGKTSGNKTPPTRKTRR